MNRIMRKNLIVLTEGEDDKRAISELLLRNESLGIRNILFDVFKHPQRQSGCINNPDAILREMTNNYDYALVVCDKEGSVKTGYTATDIKNKIESNLQINGWKDRCAAIVIEPELEQWVWSHSSEVDRVLGWNKSSENLRNWLMGKGFIHSATEKPFRPKEAMEAALRHVKKPRSSSLFSELAKSVSFSRCTDQSFIELKSILRQWFGTGQSV